MTGRDYYSLDGFLRAVEDIGLKKRIMDGGNL